MSTITNASDLRRKIDLEKELAKNYAVQQNYLIALKNLNQNPPQTRFDIGLPPYNHQSHLWDVGLEKSVLYDIAMDIGIHFIENNEIEDHVFTKMYEPDIILQILGETIFLLIESGFQIQFNHMFGIPVEDLFNDVQMKMHWEASLLRLFASPTLDNFLEDFHIFFEEIMSKSSDVEFSNSDNRKIIEYDRAPDFIDIIPNIGLKISF